MKRLKSYFSSKATVKKSAIFGRGLFAIRPIKKGETVLKYGGFVAGSIRTWLSRIFVGDYDWQIGRGKFIMPLSIGTLEEVHRFNHSCNPNLGVKDQRTAVALRDIKVGEELTLDYAIISTNEPFFLFQYHFDCLCGFKECRKIITGDDWKRKDLQEKYQGYFTTYLEKKIRALNSKKH